MIFWCQLCGEQHTMPRVASANINVCAKCGGQNFATWQPARLGAHHPPSQESVRSEALIELQNYAESFAAGDEGLHLAPENWHRMRGLIRTLQFHARVAEDERSCTCHPDDNPPVPCPKKYAITECRKAASRVPAKEQPGEQKWIAVEERLPDEDEGGSDDVLVWTLEGYHGIAMWHAPQWYIGGEVVSVTHWQPLPPPPERP